MDQENQRHWFTIAGLIQEHGTERVGQAREVFERHAQQYRYHTQELRQGEAGRRLREDDPVAALYLEARDNDTQARLYIEGRMKTYLQGLSEPEFRKRLEEGVEIKLRIRGGTRATSGTPSRVMVEEVARMLMAASRDRYAALEATGFGIHRLLEELGERLPE